MRGIFVCICSVRTQSETFMRDWEADTWNLRLPVLQALVHAIAALQPMNLVQIGAPAPTQVLCPAPSCTSIQLDATALFSGCAAIVTQVGSSTMHHASRTRMHCRNYAPPGEERPGIRGCSKRRNARPRAKRCSMQSTPRCATRSCPAGSDVPHVIRGVVGQCVFPFLFGLGSFTFTDSQRSAHTLRQRKWANVAICTCAAGCAPRVACCMLHAACCLLHVACRVLPVACRVLHVACRL
jgi:hypothetical protein